MHKRMRGMRITPEMCKYVFETDSYNRTLCDWQEFIRATAWGSSVSWMSFRGRISGFLRSTNRILAYVPGESR